MDERGCSVLAEGHPRHPRSSMLTN